MAKKLTKNSFKRKVIVFGIMIFMSVALISTGFAAWIISTNAINESTTGNINVGVISDQNIEIAGVSLSKPSFEFEPKKTDTTGRLRGDGVADEVLEVTVTAFISNATILKDLKVTLDLTGALGVKAAAGADYIVLPGCADSAINLVTNGVAEADVTLAAATEGELTAAGLTSFTDAKKLTFKIAFAWGTEFGGENPGEYYDSAAGAKVKDADMKTALQNFRKTMYQISGDDANAEGTAQQFKIVLEAIAN